MNLRTALLAATILAAPLAGAWAAPIDGVYVSAGAGLNLVQNEKFTSPALPGGSVTMQFNSGFVGLGAAGYGFGNGLRIELEGLYSKNSAKNASDNEQKYGALGNALFDFSIDAPVTPYLGAGAGYLDGKFAHNAGAGLNGSTEGSFAYQGIAGLAADIATVPGLAVTAEYRFLGLTGDRHYDVAGTSERATTSKEFNHSVLLGLRYAFNVAPAAPPPAAAPAPVAAPSPAPARTYLVFFDWDRADLTERARGIIKEAATASTKVQLVKIEVNGHADLSGTPQYNQKLSERRAQAVAAELIRDGVNQASIDLHAYGDTKPLVPTARGVREPQNRRVEIIFR